MLVELSLAALGLTLVWHLNYTRDKGRVPMKTHFSIPFLGRLPFIMYSRLLDPSRCLYHDLMDIVQHPVVSDFVGLQRFVTINGYDAIRTAFTECGDAFSDRPLNPFFHLLSMHKGILFSEGDLWKDHRRFSLKVLRDLGLGRSKMEQVISVEAGELTANFAALEGRPVHPKDLLVKAVTNVIGGLVFSERCGYEDPDFLSNIEHVNNMTQVGSPLQFLAVFYPFLCQPWFINLVPSLNKTLVSRDCLDRMCRDRVNRIRLSFDASDTGKEPENLVEAYLMERQRRLSAGNTGSSFDDEDQLVQVVLDLYIAGSDTTTATLCWLLLYSALHPDEQRLCQEELDQVCPDGNPIRLEDRKRLHRVQAFIDEGFRMSSILVHNVDRRVLRDTEFLGRLIPKEAIVYINLYGHHHDPKFFPEPNQFKPERFLNAEGSYQPSQYLFPFGLGKRSCLGEALARSETFLLFATLLQRFSVQATAVTLAEADKLLIGKDGIVRAPAFHELRMVARSG